MYYLSLLLNYRHRTNPLRDFFEIWQPNSSRRSKSIADSFKSVRSKRKVPGTNYHTDNEPTLKCLSHYFPADFRDFWRQRRSLPLKCLVSIDASLKVILEKSYENKTVFDFQPILGIFKCIFLFSGRFSRFLKTKA